MALDLAGNSLGRRENATDAEEGLGGPSSSKTNPQWSDWFLLVAAEPTYSFEVGP